MDIDTNKVLFIKSFIEKKRKTLDYSVLGLHERYTAPSYIYEIYLKYTRSTLLSYKCIQA